MNRQQQALTARRKLFDALRRLDAGDASLAVASVMGAWSALAEPYLARARSRSERVPYPRHDDVEPGLAREYLTRALRALKTNRRVALIEVGRAQCALMWPVTHEAPSRRS